MARKGRNVTQRRKLKGGGELHEVFHTEVLEKYNAVKLSKVKIGNTYVVRQMDSETADIKKLGTFPIVNKTKRGEYITIHFREDDGRIGITTYHADNIYMGSNGIFFTKVTEGGSKKRNLKRLTRRKYY